MHTSLHTQVTLCAQTGPACFLDSVDTLISLIQHNLAKIYACAHNNIACMRTSLHAMVTLCAQTGPAYSPDSFDLIQCGQDVDLLMQEHRVHPW